MNEIEMSKIYEDANNQSCAAAMEQSITFWKEKGLDFLREYREEYLKLMEDLDNKTLLALLPFITDVNAELELLKKQKEENMNMYGLGFDTGTDEEDETEEEDLDV